MATQESTDDADDDAYPQALEESLKISHTLYGYSQMLGDLSDTIGARDRGAFEECDDEVMSILEAQVKKARGDVSKVDVRMNSLDVEEVDATELVLENIDEASERTTAAYEAGQRVLESIDEDRRRLVGPQLVVFLEELREIVQKLSLVDRHRSR